MLHIEEDVCLIYSLQSTHPLPGPMMSVKQLYRKGVSIAEGLTAFTALTCVSFCVRQHVSCPVHAASWVRDDTQGPPGI